MTKSVVVGTAGHIDHGKSSLVLALTGTDPDRLKEEKARGITIDLGFAHARVGEVNLAFVDVPGHERFVKNMLAGVGGIDAVLLVIAADESVMPQTREHFAICRLLQIPRGVIVLTKSDLVDAATLTLAAADARALVEGSLLADAPIVAVSARTGAGLDTLRDALAHVASTVSTRSAAGEPRLPIDRVFSMHGFGTVVTGTLTRGTIHLEDELVVLPSGRRVKVRGVQVHGAAQTAVEAGHRVAVNLSGVDVEDVNRGDTLAAADAFEVTRRFDAMIEILPDSKPLRHGSRVRFHHGTAELLARIALAGAETTKDLDADGADSTRAADRKGLSEIAAGGRAYARVRLEAPAVLTRGDRFVIRQYSPSITIGGGVVLDPVPARTPLRTAAAASRFARLAASDGEAAMVVVEESRASGITASGLARRVGARPSGTTVTIGSTLFSADVVSNLEARLLAEIDAYHRAQPMAAGVPREEARVRVLGAASPASPELFDGIVQRLLAAGTVTGRDRLALSGRGLSLSPEEARAHAALEQVFREAGFVPPDLAGAAASAGIALPVADRVSKLLLRQKTLVRLDTILFHAGTLERLKQDVAEMKGTAAKIDVAAFKGRYGVSRKYAIPLLEWLDRERVTRRIGDARVIL